MTIFFKEGCSKCDYIKEAVDLDKLNIKIEVLNDTNYDALAHLAFHEAVSLAEITMPILVLDDCSVMTGAIKIKNYLLTLKKI